MKIFRLIIIFAISLGMVSFGTADTVKIASIYGKTGEAASEYLLHLKGVRLAVEELNKQGGFLGKQIELIELDNKSTPLAAKLAAKKAIKLKVIAVIGAAWSSSSLGMAPVLQVAKIPMIASTATHPDVTLAGDYIFRVCFIDPFQGEVVANFAYKDLNAKKSVVLTNTGNKYSPGLADVFIDAFKKLGGEVLWNGKYIGEETQFDAMLNKVKTIQPDVIFIPGYLRDSAMIIKQARKMGVSGIFLGGDGWGPTMYKYAGDSINGNYYCNHWNQKIPYAANQHFLTSYVKKYGQEEITSGAALGYDAVMLLANAIERSKSLDPKQIQKALASTQNFESTTGVIKIDQNGDPIKPGVMLKFDHGKEVFVKSIRP